MERNGAGSAVRSVKAEEAVRLARLANRQDAGGGSGPRLSPVVVERRPLWRRLLPGLAT